MHVITGLYYVNSAGFRFGEEEFRPGIIALIMPDGSVRQVADDIAFPNGMVATPDNSTLIIAESWASRMARCPPGDELFVGQGVPAGDAVVDDRCFAPTLLESDMIVFG